MDLLGKKERRGKDVKGVLKRNWLLLATISSVILGKICALVHRRISLDCAWSYLYACINIYNMHVITSHGHVAQSCDTFVLYRAQLLYSFTSIACLWQNMRSIARLTVSTLHWMYWLLQISIGVFMWEWNELKLWSCVRVSHHHIFYYREKRDQTVTSLYSS